MSKCRISVITATYNSAEHIPVLINSLEQQTDKNFEWIVADGGSSDSTVELVKSIRGVSVIISSESDFGIYDAINRAIKMSSCDYYVVIGSDDFFFLSAIESFNKALVDSDFDIITARLKFGSKIKGVRGGLSLLNKQFTHVSGHSVSTLFKKELHDYVGLYSKAYPIAADQDFILKAIKHGVKIKEIGDVVGCFTLGGASSVDVLGNLTESLRIQVKYESKLLALSVFLLKIVKNYGKI